MRAPLQRLSCVLLLVLAGCALMEPQPPLSATVVRGAPAPARIFAGAARVALTPVPHAVPLAGFGPSPKFASEATEDLYARALSLRGEHAIDRGVSRVVLVSIDQLIVTDSFRQEVLDQLRTLMPIMPGEESVPTEIILCATHTHFGIGGFWKGTLPEALSIGPYDAEVTRDTALKVARAIEAAVSSERPARFKHGALSCPDFVQCRAFGKSTVDPELLALAFDGQDGRPIARAVVFAAHPTELYGTDKLSPAWPGACARQLEQDAPGSVALVFQGGVGDQRPDMAPIVHGTPGMNLGDVAAVASATPRLMRSLLYGAEVGGEARRALNEGRKSSESVVLRLARAPFSLPLPTLGACPIPILDRLLAIPVAMPYWPDETVLRVLRLGDVALAFSPFELCAETTLRVKKRLREAGYADAAVISHANDWLGYAPDAFPWPWTTSGLTSFGGTGMGYAVGDRLAEQAERIGPKWK